jgi:uncharacterized protein YuzE
MKTSYDPAADAFYARFAPDSAVIIETREVAPNVNIDLDANGELVGIEVLHVSRRDPGEVKLAAE